MLNHIWFALIAIGILVAAGRDIHDSVTDRHANGAVWTIDGEALAGSPRSTAFRAPVRLRASELRMRFSDIIVPDSGLVATASLTLGSAGRGTIALTLGEDAPPRLVEIARAQGDAALLRGTLASPPHPGEASLRVTFDPVRLVWMRAVTNAAFSAAGTAVEIALGLIGIMALWLGVMKVAEEAGLVLVLSRAVAPLTRRIFPDVPPEHPAVAAMLMNISANMLGLGNAATPFGLKAMEELNKLNTRAGTATDAMVTFLALNTSCVTLVPATAIAIRAAAGSADPALIIGTSFLASLTATIAGLTMSRLLRRTRMYRLERHD